MLSLIVTCALTLDAAHKCPRRFLLDHVLGEGSRCPLLFECVFQFKREHSLQHWPVVRVRMKLLMQPRVIRRWNYHTLRLVPCLNEILCFFEATSLLLWSLKLASWGSISRKGFRDWMRNQAKLAHLPAFPDSCCCRSIVCQLIFGSSHRSLNPSHVPLLCYHLLILVDFCSLQKPSIEIEATSTLMSRIVVGYHVWKWMRILSLMMNEELILNLICNSSCEKPLSPFLFLPLP